MRLPNLVSLGIEADHFGRSGNAYYQEGANERS